MPNHVAINPQEHKAYGISEERSVEMGDGLMCCLTFPEEFRNLQAHYPILFRKTPERDGYICLAIFGFEEGENLFLKDSKWDARYIPLAMDIAPFQIGQSKSDEGKQKIVLDLDDPRVVKNGGRKMFDDGGVATPYIEAISNKLGFLDAGYKGYPAFIDALEKYELLEPLAIDVTLCDGSSNRFMGFHTIHEEKLEALDATALHELHGAGYLSPIYMMLASLANLSNLIDRKDERILHAR